MKSTLYFLSPGASEYHISIWNCVLCVLILDMIAREMHICTSVQLHIALFNHHVHHYVYQNPNPPASPPATHVLYTHVRNDDDDFVLVSHRFNLVSSRLCASQNTDNLMRYARALA